MYIIRDKAAPAQRTGTFKLVEYSPTGTPTTLDTVTDRETGLAKFDEQLREHPVRYGKFNFRLVLVEANGGDR